MGEACGPDAEDGWKPAQGEYHGAACCYVYTGGSPGGRVLKRR